MAADAWQDCVSRDDPWRRAVSVGAHGGHGNAIAQSYSHSILPLLPPRDRELQIAWGIDDFVFRFGRKPAGMWLPECAADDDTLASVAAAGIQFVILAPDQGNFRGPGAESRSAGPFQWRSGDLSLAVFRFDRELSNTVSFGDGMADGARLAEWIASHRAQSGAGRGADDRDRRRNVWAS